MSVSSINHWEAHWTKLWRLLVIMFLALGLYSCSAKKASSKPRQAPPRAAADMPSQKASSTMASQTGSATAPMGQVRSDGVFKIQEARALEATGQTTIRMNFSQPVTQFRHFTLSIPTRIVLDVFGNVEPMSSDETFNVGTSWVNKVKLGTGKGHYRVVVEVNSGQVPHFSVEPDDNGLSLIIGPLNRKISTKKEVLMVQSGRRVTMAAAPAPSAPGTPGTVPSPQTGSSQSSAEQKEYTGQRISLDFKDADIKNVFRLLAEISGLNIVVTEDVVKKVTVRLVDIP
ncbi:MAG: AMIN domain-containing protein, partial [Deltaproteobacteria bacterium]|nr:AMIN domain-containing protein [Deltaproteobacteria bacterium]